jgi:Bacterial Ig domain
VVKVLSTNDPPVAVDDAASTSRGVAKSIRPWLNDTDHEGGLVQGSIVRACVNEPSGCGTEDADLHGTWAISSGQVRYTPTAGYTGPASYRYRICDIDAACDDATIRFEVIDNDPPIAAVDHASVLEDGGPITFDVLGNDSDPDGQIVSGSVSMSTLTCEKHTGFEFVQCVIAVIGAAHGEWSSNGDGTITYTPDPDYSNTGWIPAVAYYMVCDDDGACSDGKAQIDVTDVNDAPYFVFTGPDQTVDEDSGQSVFTTWARWAPGPVRFLTKAGDESQQSVDILVEADDPSLFSAQPTIDAAGDLRFTPAPDAHGSTEVTVRLHDDGGTANGGVDTSEPVTFTITINGVDDAPVAHDDAATTDEDTPVSIDVLANDVDADGDALSITSVSDPAIGPVTVESGKLRYVPDANRSGSDSFSYTVCDPSGECATATVDVTITEIPDPPAVAGNSSTQTVQYSDAIASVKFTTSDEDDDAGDLALTSSSLPTGSRHRQR